MKSVQCTEIFIQNVKAQLGKSTIVLGNCKVMTGCVRLIDQYRSLCNTGVLNQLLFDRFYKKGLLYIVSLTTCVAVLGQN